MITHPISYNIAKELVSYNHITGELMWLPRTNKHIKKESSLKSWNTRYSNKKILTVDNKGYLQVIIFGKAYRAHRLCWFIYYGEWPLIIDHINGDRCDNRIINLRSVTNQQNHLNQKINSKNTSGVCGVYYSKNRSIWCSQMKFNGKTYHIGSSKSFFEAICLRKSEENKLGFSERHGAKK